MILLIKQAEVNVPFLPEPSSATEPGLVANVIKAPAELLPVSAEITVSHLVPDREVDEYGLSWQASKKTRLR